MVFRHDGGELRRSGGTQSLRTDAGVIDIDVMAAREAGARLKQRLMELYFRDGGDLTDVNVLVQAAADCGLDASDVRARLAADEDVALVSGNAQEAAEKGISGVPTYVFAQKYAVSGAQDPQMLAQAIRQVSAEINAQAAE